MDALRRLIADVLQVDEAAVTPDTAIHDSANWDSLTHMELIVMLEEKFRIELTQDEIVAMASVKAICQILEKRGVLTP